MYFIGWKYNYGNSSLITGKRQDLGSGILLNIYFETALAEEKRFRKVKLVPAAGIAIAHAWSREKYLVVVVVLSSGTVFHTSDFLEAF